MPRKLRSGAEDLHEIYATYASPVFLTAAELVTAVRFNNKREARQHYNMLLLNLAEMASDLGFKEAELLHEASDSFDRG